MARRVKGAGTVSSCLGWRGALRVLMARSVMMKMRDEGVILNGDARCCWLVDWLILLSDEANFSEEMAGWWKR